MIDRLLNLLTALSLLLCVAVCVLCARSCAGTIVAVLMLGLLVVWRRSYKVSHEFTRYSRSRGVIFTISFGQFRLYCNRPARPNETTGFFHRRWAFAPTFDVNRSPMDHAHWRRGGFSYAHGENNETHTRYRLASVPIWLLFVLLGITAALMAAWPAAGR